MLVVPFSLTHKKNLPILFITRANSINNSIETKSYINCGERLEEKKDG